MSATAKSFQNGRLPKEAPFAAGTQVVRVTKQGHRVVLEPVRDEWPASFRAALGTWRGSIERPVQASLRSLRDPFA